MEIIPAIDLMDGKCVRLTQGDYAQRKTYALTPLDLAQNFENAGFRRLHLVDLDGARAGKVINLQILRTIAEKTSLIIDFSGGVRSTEEAQAVFDAGAAMLALGSIAVRNHKLFCDWLAKFGSAKIILSADVRGGKIQVSGWTEQTSLELVEFLRQYCACGVSQVTCTDIGRDGALAGPACDLYRSLVEEFPTLSIIASGGVGNIADVRELASVGVSGVIVGKAIYEGAVSLEELKKCTQNV